jgi:hypothetical protein
MFMFFVFMFKNGLVLYLGLKLTNHTFKQKPNSSRETVPLILAFF